MSKSAYWQLFVLVLMGCAWQSAEAQNKRLVSKFPALLNLANDYENVEVRSAISNVINGKFESVPILEKAASEKDVAACYALAAINAIGEGVEKSEKKAVDLLKQNVDGQHPPSLVLMGMLREDSAPGESLRYYRTAAAADDPFANLKLGDVFENGRMGVPVNRELGSKHYLAASNAGNALGNFHAARCYEKGIGVSPNPLLASRLYRRAAMSGLANAHPKMARIYFEGKGVEADPVAALGWLFRGSKFGSTEAMVQLGQRYENGDIVPRDLNAAGQLYSNAAKLGDVTGNFSLARLYYDGKGTKQDKVRAFVLLHDAQILPKAKELYEKIAGELTAAQKNSAQEKIKQASQNGQ